MNGFLNRHELEICFPCDASMVTNVIREDPCSDVLGVWDLARRDRGSPPCMIRMTSLISDLPPHSLSRLDGHENVSLFAVLLSFFETLSLCSSHT